MKFSMARLNTRVSQAGPRSVFFASWALLSILSALWSLATPIAAAPDEPAHIVKAASVVRGEFIGPSAAFGSVVDVPRYVAWTNSQACYARQPAVTANCIQDTPGNPWTTVQTTTSAGLYNPVYYLLVGWPSLIFRDSSGVFAMRIVSGALMSVFLALGVMMIAGWRRRAMPAAAFAIALTPMVFFLNGSVNPNSLEIAGILAAFIGMLSIVLHPDAAVLRSRGVIVMVAASLAVNSRGLSALWMAVALFAPLMLVRKSDLFALLKTRIVRLAIVVIGASTALALLWIPLAAALASRAANARSAPAPVYPFTGASPLTGFTRMLSLSVSQFNGMVGDFGWLDTPAPDGVYALWLILTGALLLCALLILRRRAAVFAAVLVAAYFLLPALAQAAYIRSGGFIWQGRYTLPLLVILVVGVGAVLAQQDFVGPAHSERRFPIVILVLWGIGQAVCFVVVLRRYTVGISGSWVAMFTHPNWQPPGGSIVACGLFVTVVAGTVVLGALWGRAASLQSDYSASDQRI